MKTSLLTLAVAVSVLSACNTPQSLSSAKYNDDIYTSSSDLAADKEKRQKDAELAKQQRAEEDRQRAEADKQRAAQVNNNQTSETSDDYYTTKRSTSTSETTTNSDGSVTNVTNNYYDRDFSYDDYYDNEYSVRLRRFHNNIGAYGYYDDYYTNSYWYTGNPYNYGSSVYLGYNFWGPTYTTFSYSPSYNWYSSVGWGYDPWYNPSSYNNPYYGGGYYGGGYGGGYYGSSYYGYNPYGYGGYGGGYGGYGSGYGGYNQGYMNGYNDGYFANNYFNSYDNNSYYYGPRGTSGSNSRTTAQPTLAHRYMTAVETETKKPFEVTKGRDNNPYLNKAANGVNRENTPIPARTDNVARPAGNKAIDYTPPANNGVRENKPVPANTNPRPTQSVDVFNEVPSERKPVKETQPNVQPSKFEQQQAQPNYEQPKREQQPKYEQPKPRNEQPKYEQQKQDVQPKFERNAVPQQAAPVNTPAPRSTNGSEAKPRR